MPLARRPSYEISQMGDNTYATILPRAIPPPGVGVSAITSNTPSDMIGGIVNDGSQHDIADYATLRNSDSRMMPSAVSNSIRSMFV